MSGPAAILIVLALLTLCGLGALAAVGAAHTLAELARLSPVAPMAGMASVGIAAATAATAGVPFGIAGLVLVTGLVGVGGAVRLGRGGDRQAPRAPRGRARNSERVLAAAGAVLVAAVTAFALGTYWFKPLVEYDGWAMWGMKAKAIAWLDADPAVLASPAYERLHLEYPLLLPALHALPIDAAQSYSSNIVVLNSVLLGIAGLIGIWGLLRDRVRPALLLPTLAAIATMPAFFYQLGSGYADVPVAMVIACGVGAAARWLLDGRTAWLALATLFLAASALTKNEGLLFAASVLASLVVVAAGRRRAVALSAGVVALVYAPWRAYIAAHDLSSPAYDLSASFDPFWVGPRLRRVPESVSSVVTRGFDPNEVGFVLALGFGACVLALLVGRNRLGLFASGFALLSLAGLSWIYVISPFEVSSFVSSSAQRVVLTSVVGLATLYPLLIEESSRALAARGEPSAHAGSLNDGGRRAPLLRRRSPPQ